MSAEKLDTEIRKEQIAQAALDMVAGHGIKGLSMAGVACKVGLVPSAIYRHFKNKNEVLDSVLDLIQDKILGNIAAAYEEASDPLDRLKGLLCHHMQMIQENRAIPRLIFSDDFFIDHPERKTRVYEIVTKYLNSVAEIILQGQHEGKVRSDADAQTISLMFLGLIQPAGVLWRLSDGRFEVTKHTERVWLLFRESIQAR